MALKSLSLFSQGANRLQRRGLLGFGVFVLDTEQLVLRGEKGVVGLPPKALATLLVLLEQRGDVVSKQQLMEAVWPESFVEEGNLTQNIFLLRKELGKTQEGEDYIQTLPKRGYRITVPIVEMNRKTESPGRPASISEANVPQTDAQDQRVAESEINVSERVASAEQESPRRGRPIAMATAIGLLLVLGLSVAGLWQQESRRPKLSGYTQITHDGAVKRGRLVTIGGPDAPLFTDGTRVYLTEGSTDALMLAEVSVFGGDTARIEVPFQDPQLLDLSRGPAELLVSGENNPATPLPLWTVTVPGGTAQQLSEVTARDASWSPDGRSLAFLRGSDLYLAKRDGTDALKLTTLTGPGFMPRWSPDGKLLRVSVFDTQSSGLWLWEIQVAGQHTTRRLLEGWNQQGGPLQVCCGSWTPDGRDFVFQATREGRSEIWAMPAEPSLLGRLGHWFKARLDEPVPLTNGQLSSLAPVLSPDGKKLFVIGQQLGSELERYDARTKQFVPYRATALGSVSADFVDISRDGQWIAYVDFLDGTLWRSRLDGSERLQLTSPPIMVMVPLWSPDAKRILFTGYNSGNQQQTYVVSAEGGKPTPVQPGGGNQMQPSWSPDGKMMMYSDFPFFVRDPSAVAVHLLDLGSQKVETLPGSKGLFSPSWSPDGAYVAALGPHGPSVMLFDFKTRAWAPVAESNGFLKWSRDSRYLYFLRTGENAAVMRLRVGDRRVEEVASLKGVRLAGRLAGIAFALTPEDDPLVLRDLGTQEVYSLEWHAQ
jgi:Tol biopolymer transport system component/DNA-binding winged helix-turn-helix (wHTH) protein